jgi:hypothetical protein
VEVRRDVDDVPADELCRDGPGNERVEQIRSDHGAGGLKAHEDLLPPL